jgi:hypothetical protein
MWLSPEQGSHRLSFNPDIRETSELSRITCDWYRVRSVHDRRTAPLTSEFCAIGPALYRIGRGQMSRTTSIELDPSGLDDLELASEFLEAARRVNLTRAGSNKSD